MEDLDERYVLMACLLSKSSCIGSPGEPYQIAMGKKLGSDQTAAFARLNWAP